MTRRFSTSAMLGAVVMLTVGLVARAQGGRPASPPRTAATQVGGKYVQGREEPVYQGGKWIEITFGSPIKRGRDLFGSGAEYGRKLLAGAPVWRAGANQTTRLKTELPLRIGDKTLAPGEYDLFIDLKPDAWTLIVSTWPVQTRYEPGNKDALWGSFGYTADKDVVRVPMKLETLPHAIDQLAWEFVDMTGEGGTIALVWDKTMASVSFRVGG